MAAPSRSPAPPASHAPLVLDGVEVTEASVWGRARRVLMPLQGPADVDALVELDPDWDHVVVVGPAGTSDRAASDAFSVVDVLVADLGLDVAHAGLELPGGFRATYCDERTARGQVVPVPDRRDALLLALALLGDDAATRLGGADRVLRGLLGPDATKPLGRALAAAVADGRWDDVHLAAAASDVLGPEKLASLLEAPAAAPDEVVLGGGGIVRPARRAAGAGAAAPGTLASATAVRSLGSARELGSLLAEVLAPYTEARRLQLLVDLRGRIAATDDPSGIAAVRASVGAEQLHHTRMHEAGQRLREQLDAVAGLEANRNLRLFGSGTGNVLRATFVTPHAGWPVEVLARTVREVLAGRVLVRLALVARDGDDDDLLAALDAHRAALAHLREPVGVGRRRVDVGRWIAEPARVAHRLLDVATLRQEGWPTEATWIDGFTLEPDDPVAFVRRELESAAALLSAALGAANDAVGLIAVTGAVVRPADLTADAYLSLRWVPLLPWRHPDAPDPATWRARADVRGEDGRPLVATPLAARRAADPDAPEHLLDLRWHAEADVELADLWNRSVLSQRVDRGWALRTELSEPDDEADPTRPQTTSARAAVAGAAQLLRLGGEVPARPRSWAALVDGLHAGFDTAQLLARTFKVPRALLEAADGARIPGTVLQARVGVNIRLIADWAGYMGNCLLSMYADDAEAGRCVILGLFDGDRLVYNLELVKRRGTWEPREFKARFNEEPSTGDDAAVRAWVATLTPPRTSDVPRVGPRPAGRRPRGGGSRGRREAERGPALDRLADAAAALVAPTGWQTTAVALATALDPGHRRPSPAAARVAVVRRLAEVPDAAATALASGSLTAPDLWSLAGATPLATAAEGLSDRERGRLTALAPLAAGDDVVGRSAARLVARDAIAEAWEWTRLGRALDAALADVAVDDDLPLARAVGDALAASPARGPVLALALVRTARRSADAGGLGRVRARRGEQRVPIDAAGVVGGHPRAELLGGGPWVEAWRRAASLAADPVATLAADTRRRVTSGLPPLVLVRSRWLDGADWSAWWARATRADRRRAEPPG
ncbi:MAG: hypothetical protein U0Q07_20825 [Acidimicrobiales bacterium]